MTFPFDMRNPSHWQEHRLNVFNDTQLNQHVNISGLQNVLERQERMIQNSLESHEWIRNSLERTERVLQNIHRQVGEPYVDIRVGLASQSSLDSGFGDSSS